MKKLVLILGIVFLNIPCNINASEQGEDCVDFAQEAIQLEMDTFGPMTFSEYNEAFGEWYQLCRSAQQ